MTCPKCGSANIQVQMVSETQLKNEASQYSVLAADRVVVEIIVVDISHPAYADYKDIQARKIQDENHT